MLSLDTTTDRLLKQQMPAAERSLPAAVPLPEQYRAAFREHRTRCRPAVPPIVAVVGHSNSGKTTLITRLIGELKRRGWSVAALKHAHHGLDLVPLAKDSGRLLQAGAETVLVAAPKQVEILRRTTADCSLQRVVARELANADLVFAEGFRKETVPRIEVHRSAVSNGLACDPSDLLALVSDRLWQLAVPQFAPEEWEFLCDLLEEEWLIPRDRTPKLVVDNKPVPLTAFATRYLDGAVRGLLCHLKGMEAGIEFRIEIQGETLLISNGLEPVEVKHFLKRSIRGAVLGLISSLDGIQGPTQVSILIPR